MLNRPFKNSESGLTLLEMMIALGLATIVTYAVFSFYSDFTGKLNRLAEDVEVNTDIESGQRIVLNDLKNVDPSFGLLTVNDDRGMAFFEQFPDLPDDAIRPTVADREKAVERVYTMKVNGGFQDIMFLLLDNKAHELPSLVYDPTWAYTIVKGANFFVEGTVTWRGINSRIDPTNGSSPHAVSDARPSSANFNGYWNHGQLLLLDTPQLFRPKDTGSNSGERPLRSVSFLGQVDGNAALAAANNYLPINRNLMRTKVQEDASENPLDSSHPVESTLASTLDIPDADRFLRYLPSAGGGQPMVRMRPVKLVHYWIEQMYPTDSDPEKKKIVKLWKQVYTAGQWNPDRNRFIVAEKLKTVQFKRPSAADKAILFDISRNELKKGGEL